MKRLIKAIVLTFVGIFVLSVVALMFVDTPPRSESPTTQATARPSPPPTERPDTIHIARSDAPASWPFIFEAGELRCQRLDAQRLAVLLIAEGQTYGLNGTAKGAGHPAADPVVKPRGPLGNIEPVSRVAEPSRRRIFAELVGCEDSGGGTACKEALRRRERLSEVEFKTISNEGLVSSWPPLAPPPPMDVSPFIRRGLALCESR